MINIDATQFTEEILARLIEEHGIPRDKFEYLVPKILVAFDTEHAITVDQLNELFHGDGDNGVPEELQQLFPLLNAIALSPYTDIDDSREVAKMELEDEEDLEDDEDEDDTEDEEDEED